MQRKKGFTPLQIRQQTGGNMHVYSKVIKFISGIKPRYSYGNARRKILHTRRFLSVTGFTLLELLIVVIIVGILASLAIPRYMKATEASKGAEAYNNLNALRQAEWAFYSKNQSFTILNDELGVENPNVIPLVADGGNRYFNYIISLDSGNNPFNVTAQRIGGQYNHDYIVMSANGNLDEDDWLVAGGYALIPIPQ